MNGRRFDELVTAFSRTASRRQLLRGLAAGTLVSLFGRRRDAGASHIPQLAQSSDPPLPNFPFMVALPTDPGLEDYQLDVDLTGAPTRFTDIAALPSLPEDWRQMVSKCRGAYVATIALPDEDRPSEPQRSITTILFDLGTPADAEATHADYVDRLLERPTRQRLATRDLPARSRDRITLIGCEGGCVDLSSPADSDFTPSDEVAAVGVTDRFIFDARIREFGSESITSSEAATLGIGIDQRLGAVGTIGSSGTTALASSSGLKQAKRAATLPGSSVSRLRMKQASDDIRQTLASAITLPIFGLGQVDPPKTAEQWLEVDQGVVIVRFGESTRSVAARQRNVNDVLFAISLRQPLPIAQPYRDDYDLVLSATQYVFESEDDARDFLTETRDRIESERPELTLTKTREAEDERSYTYEHEESANAPIFGVLTHTFVVAPSFWAVIAVDLAAVPSSSSAAQLDANDLEPLVVQLSTVLGDCLVTPGSCPSTPYSPSQKPRRLSQPRQRPPVRPIPSSAARSASTSPTTRRTAAAAWPRALRD